MIARWLARFLFKVVNEIAKLETADEPLPQGGPPIILGLADGQPSFGFGPYSVVGDCDT